MKIAVFGYSEFTRHCVQEFLDRQYEVLLLCPECDRELFASSGMHNLPVQQELFDSMADPALRQSLAEYQPDYILSIIFSHKIPDSVLALARYAALNFHPAPLPEFRTANAWYWPLRHGVTTSAISVHHMTNQWDSGDIALLLPFPVDPWETQGTYSRKVSQLAPVLVHQLDALFRSTRLPRIPQGSGQYYGKVGLKDVFIDFSQSASSIEAHIRACNPFHFAQTMFRGMNIEIVEADIVSAPALETPGVLRVEGEKLFCATGHGQLQLSIVSVPMEGTFSAQRFVRAYGVKSGERFCHISEFPQYQHLLDA